MSSEVVMTTPWSQDLRRRLVRAVEKGLSARAAAEQFEVSALAAIKLVRHARETGSTAPARIGGYRKPLRAEHEDLLRKLTSTRKGITLAEIRDKLVASNIALGSLATIWATLKRSGLSQKKFAEGGQAGSA
ncbi:MAG: hypothetical protein ACRYG8_25820 [Janthinobacterium lividum]